MHWYDEEVKLLERKIAGLTYEPAVVFYGSSSIRQWDNLQWDFEGYAPLNLGFGGSTLEACSAFFSRVFAGVHPKAIIIYAGDNDLGDGKKPEDVLYFFQNLQKQIIARYKDVPVGFISIKPSFERWDIVDNIKKTNRLVEQEISAHFPATTYINIFDQMIDDEGYPKKNYFDADGLHINTEGYALWRDVILQNLQLPVFSGLKLASESTG